MLLIARQALAQVPLSIITPDMGPAVPISLPRDHGAHLETESEWWPLKG
jgi:predicted secreted hydrolase